MTSTPENLEHEGDLCYYIANSRIRTKITYPSLWLADDRWLKCVETYFLHIPITGIALFKPEINYQ